MNYRKQLTYKGIKCEGKSKVLPPTFQGIKALVKRAGGNEDVVAATFPPLEFVDDQEHSLVAEFVTELQNCDKIERVDLVRQFDEYVKDLRASKDGKGKGGTQGPNPNEEKKDETKTTTPVAASAQPDQAAAPEET